MIWLVYCVTVLVLRWFAFLLLYVYYSTTYHRRITAPPGKHAQFSNISFCVYVLSNVLCCLLAFFVFILLLTLALVWLYLNQRFALNQRRFILLYTALTIKKPFSKPCQTHLATRLPRACARRGLGVCSYNTFTFSPTIGGICWKQGI